MFVQDMIFFLNPTYINDVWLTNFEMLRYSDYWCEFEYTLKWSSNIYCGRASFSSHFEHTQNKMCPTSQICWSSTWLYQVCKIIQSLPIQMKQNCPTVGFYLSGFVLNYFLGYTQRLACFTWYAFVYMKYYKLMFINN